MKSISPLVPLLFALCISACGSDNNTGTKDDGTACPDVVYYDDPLVRVNSVTDSSNNDSLVQVTFSELTIDGRSTGFDALTSSVIERLDISSDGQSAVCTLPCALFSTEGEYSMVVTAPSFESKLVEFEPTYEDDGGPPCPIRFSGSHELSISLDPQH